MTGRIWGVLVILNNDLKKQAIASYEASLKELQTLFGAAQAAISRLNMKRKDAVDLLSKVNSVINTISNTPKEISMNIQKVAMNTASFQPVDELTQEAISGYIDAAGELLKGAGRGWVHIGSGDLMGKVFGWIMIALHTFLSVAKLSITNMEIYEKAKEQTKKVKAHNTRIRSYITKIDGLAEKTSLVYNPLLLQYDDLSRYRFCDYASLSVEEKKFLGEIVNNSLTLSQLLSSDADYKESADE